MTTHRHTVDCLGATEDEQLCCADRSDDDFDHAGGYVIRTHAGDIPVFATSLTDACAIVVAAGHRLVIDGRPVGSHAPVAS